MSNRRNIQFLYNPHNKGTLLDCSFTVASSDSAGLGITGLQASGRIASVYMHTSATAAAGNPNPESGIIIVNLQDNYNKYLAHAASFEVPLSGSSVSISSGLTQYDPYVITALGTSTQANWEAVGVPSHITAAVGVSFIASTSSAGTGTGTVQAPAASGAGIFNLALIGNPSLMNSNGAIVLGAGNGMQLIFGCYKDSSSDAPVLAAPSDGTVVSLMLYLNDSAQGV